MVVAMSWWAVIISTGASAARFFSSGIRSMPLASGSRMSSTMAAGGDCSAMRKPSAPVAAESTPKPRSSRCIESSSRMLRSSSTIRIRSTRAHHTDEKQNLTAEAQRARRFAEFDFFKNQKTSALSAPPRCAGSLYLCAECDGDHVAAGGAFVDAGVAAVLAGDAGHHREAEAGAARALGREGDERVLSQLGRQRAAGV